jgi:glyoxylase-like metal-dependent hydrolase (beta-lactamase superfamily II)
MAGTTYSGKTYEVFAIKYGERIGTRGEIFVGGDPHDSPLPMDYFIWLIRNDDREIVVDLGFGKQEGLSRGRDYLRSPVDGLKLLDVQAENVPDVIITHMHYDHAGNLDQFPNARFHVQDLELEYVTGRAMTHKFLRSSYAVEDVVAMVRMIYKDRVIFHHGVEEIAEGICVHPVAGHARGLQCITVETKIGKLVLASDAAHYYENLEKGIPFSIHENRFHLLEGYRRVQTLGATPNHVIPGHDPEVMKRYPAPSPDLEGIIVRLDVNPAI